MQYPRRRPIASPLEVFERRPQAAEFAAPTVTDRHPKTFTKPEVLEHSIFGYSSLVGHELLIACIVAKVCDPD
jgi:hypothetical protein